MDRPRPDDSAPTVDDLPGRADGGPPPAADATATAPAPSAPDGDALPGVPGYQIAGLLGRGSMGVVYKARHLALKRDVALKMILAGAHAGAREVARFRAEAEAAARLLHPNIVQVFEVGEHAGLPYCALEFVAGGSLARLLREKAPAPAEAARLVAALADALHLAHSRNVVHRDLKPGNVLLAEDGTPKVADFGLARRLDVEGGGTQTGVVVGTPAYMAPEQAAGRANEAGPAADVWALGGVLYECLAGRPPFEGTTVVQTLEQVLHREPSPPSRLRRGVSRDLDTICLKCLQKVPERRYASAKELADDLRRFLGGEPVAARPAGRLERLAKWARRRPAAAALGGMALLVVALAAAAAVVLLSFQRQADAARAAAADAQAEQAREAEQRATEREQQAKDKERQTRESLEQLEDALAENLMRPVGFGAAATPAEVETLRDLASSPSDRLRVRFLEKALDKPPTAERLARRADEVAQAVVGLDAARRVRVTALLMARLRDPATGREARAACVALGTALDARDADFCRAAAATRLAQLAETTNPNEAFSLAESLWDWTEPLPPEEAGKARAAMDHRLVTIIVRGDDPNVWQGRWWLPDWAGRLSREDAEVVARRVLAVMDKAPYPNAFHWFLRATAHGLPPDEAAAEARKRIALLARTDDPVAFARLAWTACGLVAGLPPAEADDAARQFLAVLSDEAGTKEWFVLGQVLGTWPTRPPPDAVAAAARKLQNALEKAENANTLSALAQTLGACTALMPPEDAAAAESAAARKLLDAATRASPPDELKLLSAARDLSRRPPASAAAWTWAALGAMTRTTHRDAFNQLSGAVEESLAHPPPVPSKVAADAVGKFLAAMDKASDAVVLAGLARALNQLAGRLPPPEASKARAGAIEAVLDALDKKSDEIDINYLSGAASVLAAGQPPEAAAAAARRLVASIDRDAREAPVRRIFLSSRAGAVVQLLPRMPRAEAERTAAEAARALFIAIDRTDDLSARTAWVDQLALLAPFESPRTALADARNGFAVLENDSTGNNYFPARVCENWAARLPVDEVATAARRLRDRMGNTAQPRVLFNYTLALAALSPRLPPDEAGKAAVAAARRILIVMDDPNSRGWGNDLAAALRAAAPALPADEAAAVSRMILARLVEATRAEPPGVNIQGGEKDYWADALAQMADRLPPEDVAAAARKLVELNWPGYSSSGRLFSRLAHRLATEDLIDLFKDPMCVRDARSVLLGELARRLGPRVVGSPGTELEFAL